MKIKYIAIALFIIDAVLITVSKFMGNLIDNYQIFCALAILIIAMTEVILDKLENYEECFYLLCDILNIRKEKKESDKKDE